MTPMMQAQVRMFLILKKTLRTTTGHTRVYKMKTKTNLSWMTQTVKITMWTPNARWLIDVR